MVKIKTLEEENKELKHLLEEAEFKYNVLKANFDETREILENKKAELEAQNYELQEKESELLLVSEEKREIFENSPNPLIIIDKDFLIKDYNLKANQDFGLQYNYKKILASVIFTDSYRALFSHITLKMYNSEPIIAKVKMFDNSIRNYKITIVDHPIYEDNFLLVFVDIQNELLMMEQSKMATMGEMIANITHQWRQPLNLISMHASELLYCKQQDINLGLDHEMKSLNEIDEQVQYLAETMNTFLNFIKSDKSTINISFQEVINKSLAIVSASLKAHYVKVNIEMPLEDIMIRSVLGELEQVIINIISNAKDAFVQNDIKEPMLDIKLSQTDAKVILTIEDNAGGIPSNLLSKIFQPYFSTKKETTGIGLGLHMCKKIVNDTLNGNIKASNSMLGAVFTIELDKVYN